MQVKYLIIGRGCLGTHISWYLTQLELPFHHWSRSDGESSLILQSQECTHVLCLIQDKAIEDFLQKNKTYFKDKIILHSSGWLTTSLAHSAHPLMTFTLSKMYELEFYKKIPFIIEKNDLSFAELLPGFPNPHYSVDKKLKTLYHALCVMSGNFSTLLWQKAFADFENRLQLPWHILLPYLFQMAANLRDTPQQALTGPLARGDTTTLEAHLHALQGDPYGEVYKAFVKAFTSTPNLTPGHSYGAYQ